MVRSSSRPAAGPLSLATLTPIAVAIGVFGMLYGAAAQPLFGTWPTVLSSLLVFSGTVQFTMVGLLGAGSSPLAVLWAVFIINIRNFALGGAVRPHLKGNYPGRALVSWFLIDETVGLALAYPRDADRTLVRAGLAAYLAWLIGTAVGVAGGALVGLEGLAAAIFPVLFIGLAALMVRGRSGVVRAVAGALMTVALLAIWPSLAGLAPVIAGVAAAIPGSRP